MNTEMTCGAGQSSPHMGILSHLNQVRNLFYYLYLPVEDSCTLVNYHLEEGGFQHSTRDDWLAFVSLV